MIGEGGRRGYRHLLDQFWDDAKDHGIPLPCDQPVSAAAFCKARRKLKPMAVRSLQQRVIDEFEQTHGSHHRFKGRRVMAVDGAKVSLQRSPELIATFGVPHGGHCPQILLSTLFDVVAKMPIDATVSRYDGSENDDLVALLPHLKLGDILVLDRGYPSYKLIAKLLATGVDFVIRVPTRGSFKAIETFLQSGGDDYRIMLGSDISAHRRPVPPLEVRAIRDEGKDGESQVFLTSLRRNNFTRGEILRLYRMRWEVELFFRLEKGDYIGHGQFHAKTPDGVRQEVFAFMLYVALTRHLMAHGG